MRHWSTISATEPRVISGETGRKIRLVTAPRGISGANVMVRGFGCQRKPCLVGWDLLLVPLERRILVQHEYMKMRRS